MPHLLIVDDSRFHRNQVIAALRDDHYELTEYENGKLAVEYLQDHDVDLILTDLLMPELDGFGILKVLQEQNRDIPIIVLSADIQTSSRELCIDLGAVGFYNKPFKPDELRSAISAALPLVTQEL